MDPKDELLSSITTLAKQNRITESEVLNAFRRAKGVTAQNLDLHSRVHPTVVEEKSAHRGTSLAKVLYFLGGIVIFAGLIILIVQNWTSFGELGQILITLGVGVVAYVAAAFLRRKAELNVASQIFAAISGILTPLGFGVLLHTLGVSTSLPETHILVGSVMFVIFAISIPIFKNVVYALFSIIYGTWIYGALVAIVLREMGGIPYGLNIYQYLIMALGGAYLLIGHSLAKSHSGEYRRLAQTLFFFGTIALLAPELTMSGIWDVIYPFVIFGAIILSVYIQSSVFLRLGSLFLMAYLIKISAKYFGDSVGWPVALVFGGVVLMGVGYLTYYLNKKYIRNSIEV